MGTQKLFCCCVGNRKGLLCFKSLDCSLVLATGRVLCSHESDISVSDAAMQCLAGPGMLM